MPPRSLTKGLATPVPRSHQHSMHIRVALLLSLACASVLMLATPASGKTRHRARAHRAVPTHVATWAYDDGCVGGKGASAGLVRAWVTYAESNCGAENPKVL